MLYNLFLTLLTFTVSQSCIDIDKPYIQPFLNVTYDNDCYEHTITKTNCCEHFLTHNTCIDSYRDCVNYKDFVINN